jgi:hypothetical protein
MQIMVILVVAREVYHDIQHFLDHLGIESRGRLVEQHDARAHCENPGYRNALLLAARELRRVSPRFLRNPDASEQFHATASASALDRPFTFLGARVMFCSAVRWRKRLKCWNTMPMSCRSVLTLVWVMN